MSWTTLVLICGWPLVISMVLVEIVLVVAAFYLVFSARRENLLQAFLPFTSVPFIAALCSVLVGIITSIDLQLNETETYALDSGLLLQMNLAPLFVGALVSLPAFGITVGGRWRLLWQASGLRLIPERKPEEEGESQEKWLSKETDDYIEKLVRAK